MKNKVIGIVLIALGIIALLTSVLLIIEKPSPVSAAGTSTINISYNGTASGGIRSYDFNGVAWTTLRAGTGLGVQSFAPKVSFSADGDSNKWNTLYREIMAFNLEGYDLSYDTIVSVKVRMCLQTQGNSFTNGVSPTLSLYRMVKPPTNGYGGVVSTGDWAKSVTGDRVSSQVVGFNEFSPLEWVDFPIFDGSIEDCIWLSNGWAYFVVGECNYDQIGTPPDWQIGKSCEIQFYASTYLPELIIEYVGDTPEREIDADTNAEKNPAPSGNETADNITWGSPRTGYADEGLYFRINGDSGALIDVSLVDEDGTVLDQVSDEVRVDGNYDYNPDLPDNWFGFVRVREANNNLVSMWGYQMPKPDDDQLANTVFAVSTEYPQYDYAFSRYLTYENDIFVLHWKTNILPGEEPDHNVEIWGNGDNVTPFFEGDLDTLNDNYFMADSNNKGLLGWRYMIFTPKVRGAGFEDWDGLVYNLDKSYGLSTSGFLQGVILDNTDNTTLANSHSCYWYLPDLVDGVVYQLSSRNLKAGAGMVLKVQIGQPCKIVDYMPDLSLDIINSEGSSVWSDTVYYTYGLNEYSFNVPVATGEYELRMSFTGDDVSWDYIHDEPFVVSAGAGLTGEESIIDMISLWIETKGLDNPTGYWIILLLGMVLLFLIAHSSPVMRVALPLVFLGCMMIWEFVDPWLIILLAIGAGLTLFGIFRKKTHGGGGPEG